VDTEWAGQRAGRQVRCRAPLPYVARFACPRSGISKPHRPALARDDERWWSSLLKHRRLIALDPVEIARAGWGVGTSSTRRLVASLRCWRSSGSAPPPVSTQTSASRLEEARDRRTRRRPRHRQTSAGTLWLQQRRRLRHGVASCCDLGVPALRDDGARGGHGEDGGAGPCRPISTLTSITMIRSTSEKTIAGAR
jgi:hypothetical protein